MQKSDATLLPTNLRENLPVKFVLGNAERQTYTTAFGAGVETPEKDFKLGHTFSTKKEAQLWALEMELAKGEGKELAHRITSFADFFENWIYLVKVNDVKETTFQNYVGTLGVIRSLFHDIQLKDLNEIVVQKKIDEYAKTHSRKTTHEVLLKIKTSLRDAYARGYIVNDFARLVKTRGENPPKRNKALSIID